MYNRRQIGVNGKTRGANAPILCYDRHMKDLLDEKLKAYRAIGPVLPEARKWLEESNLWMLLYTVLCQRGVRIEKKMLVDILAGRIMEDVHIDLYGFCFRLRDEGLHLHILQCLQSG